MGTTREGKTSQGAHAYRLSNGTEAVCMGNGEWYIFGPDGRDLGVDFKTLRQCRVWAKNNPQDPT